MPPPGRPRPCQRELAASGSNDSQLASGSHSECSENQPAPGGIGSHSCYRHRRRKKNSLKVQKKVRNKKTCKEEKQESSGAHRGSPAQGVGPCICSEKVVLDLASELSTETNTIEMDGEEY